MTAPTVPAPVTFPTNPGPQLACVLLDTAAPYLGIHYLPSPTITLGGQNAAINQSGNHPTAIGATSWTVVDSAGQQVGAGTMADTATTITVCSAGAWVGGTTAVPGHYTVITNPGSNGVVTGHISMNSAATNLHVPAAGDPPQSLSAWLGGAPDRDYYQTPQIVYTPYTTAAASGAAIVADYQADAYFQGTQDSARPHKLWIASYTQATSPTQAPTSTWWGQLAAYLAANGCAGAWYEAPTNEPENGGWSLSGIITYWQACSATILAADPTAHVMGWCSAGIYNNSPITAVATFLASCTPAAFTNHMENSHQNLGDFVALRQYFAGLKAQFVASGVPDMDLWLTETGINDGGYGVLQPRRAARQRPLLRLVAESFGWAKENCYDFLVFDHQGSGLAMYQVDRMANGGGGNVRAGDHALHVLAEALHGTPCTPTNIPAKLSFGPTGSAGDSLFMGVHYTGTTRDVVVLATNGIPSATVTLATNATGTVTWWDGMGVPGTATVTGGHVTIPVNDLLTYLFLPTGSTVSVVDTDQGVVALSAGVNLASTATVVNEGGSGVASVHNGSFAENNSAVTGVTAPYADPNVPSTLTFTNLGGTSGPKTITGFAFKGPAPAWQTAGSSFTAFTVTADGNEVFSYTDPTAVSAPVPSPSNGNSSDPCTRTTWWRSPYGFVVTFPTPVTASTIELSITATGYGGQPDAAASALSEGDPQAVQLSEFQIFGTTSGGGSGGGTGTLGHYRIEAGAAVTDTRYRIEGGEAVTDTVTRIT